MHLSVIYFLIFIYQPLDISNINNETVLFRRTFTPTNLILTFETPKKFELFQIRDFFI
jgi:hypothetical protein